MKKILCMMLAIILISSMALTGCGNKKGIEKKASSENELQSGKGINGKLPDIKYNYEAIADAPGGICPQPSVYKDNYSDNMNQWRKNAQKELKKISHKFG
jgi:Ca-activated chloride channel family protein